MTKQLLYLFGEPGTGKITTARILEKRLGWKLFWLHDLDSVCKIVSRYPLPRLMDRISEAVLEELMAAGENILYVRPSRDAKTRRGVSALCVKNDYCCIKVRLWAPYETMVQRVTSRTPAEFRAGSKEELDRYLRSRPSTIPAGIADHNVNTAGKSPEQVADEIERILTTKE